MKSTLAIPVALLVGVVVGSLGNFTPLSTPAGSAIAATMAPMSTPSDFSTSTMSMPIGDAQMMKAMTSMDAATKRVHLNGDQDHDFMQLMIPHHQAAIEMAKVELRYGIQPQLKTEARNIIKSQTAEIAQMRQWLCKWDADCKGR